MLAVQPENFVLLNGKDAKGMNLKDGDLVKVVSATNKEGVWDLKNGVRKQMIGKVKVTEIMKPGVMSFTLGHGHWATGSADVTIDKKVVKGDPRRATGGSGPAPGHPGPDRPRRRRHAPARL